MTLVETMVTLGIASVMMLGILELVNLSSRSNRNVTTVSEFNNLVNNIRLSLQDPTKCKEALGIDPPTTTQPLVTQGAPYQAGDTVIPTYGPPTPTELTTFAIGTPGNVITIADTGQNTYSNFSIQSMILSDATPAPGPQNVLVSGCHYNQYTANLNITGIKKAAPNQANALGGNIMVYPQIQMSLLVGPTDATGSLPGCTKNQALTTIYSCFSDQDLLSEMCSALGGTWYDSPPAVNQPRCVIQHQQFFAQADTTPDATVLSAAKGDASNALTGEKLQLWGTFGTQALTDFAIGLDGGVTANQMWFNMGGNAQDFYSNPGSGNYNAFLWHAHPSSNALANASNGTEATLLELDSGGNLILDPTSDFFQARLAFGPNLRNVGSIPSEYIQSTRRPYGNGGGQSGYGEDLEFYTLGKNRITILNTGEVQFHSDDGAGNPQGGIITLTTSGGTMPSATIGAGTTAGTRSSYIWGNAPAKDLELYANGIQGLTIDSGGNTGVSQALSVAGAATFSGTATFNGATKIKAIGGNVPHDCTTRWVTTPSQVHSPLGYVTASCQGGEIILGGGIQCGDGNTALIASSYPNGNSWTGACSNQGCGFNCPPDPENVTAYAICCSQ